MTRDAEHTPSPQSVVVPVDLLSRALEELRMIRMKDCDAVYDTTLRVDLQLARQLAAAPAPSSLAGGEVREAVARTEDRIGSRLMKAKDEAWNLVPQGQRAKWIEDNLASATVEVSYSDLRAILAALSPEAPAREGVVKACADFQEAIDYFEADVADALAEDSERADLWDREVTVNIDALKTVMSAALTPRHEAPACDDCGSPLNSDGECTRDLAEREADDRHEAPAEGAGEDADRLMQEFYLSRDYDPKAARPADTVKAAIAFALRARSSAPEALEREAVGHAGAMPGSSGFTMAAFKASDVPLGTPLYTHPAAPSADKLRIAVEAMQGAIEWDKRTGYRMPYRVRDPLYAAIDISTPDALKGDAKS